MSSSASPDQSPEPAAPADQAPLPDGEQRPEDHRPPQDVPAPRLTASQAQRARQTSRAMLYSVLATLAIVVLVIMLNPASRPELYERTVDVPGIAGEATAALPYTALAPQVPEDWRASYARLVSGQGSQVQAWEAGYVTAAEEYAQFVQTDQADPTWLSQAVDGSPMTGTRAVRDVQWDLYEKQGEDSHLVGELNGTTVVVTTSAGLEDLDTLAAALVDRAAVVASETSPSPSPSTSAEG